MFRIFSGSWRGPDLSGSKVFVNLDVRFREILYQFKGAKLSVLIYLALRMDENGECYPSYDLMERETGYSRPVISAAIKELCETRIDGKIVLMRWRSKDEKGHFEGSTHYKLFPSSEEYPELGKPPSGETSLEVEPKYIKDEPDSSKTDERKQRKRDVIHDALVEVTGYPPGSFCGKVVSLLRKANPVSTDEWIADQVRKRFGPDSPWFTYDFRGQKGQKPTPMMVLQEWSRVIDYIIAVRESRKKFNPFTGVVE